MASMKNSRNKSTVSTAGKVGKKKIKKQDQNRIEIEEPFMKTSQLFKEGKGTELRKGKTLKPKKKKGK